LGYRGRGGGVKPNKNLRRLRAFCAFCNKKKTVRERKQVREERQKTDEYEDGQAGIKEYKNEERND
jgi:hypothetical protein